MTDDPASGSGLSDDQQQAQAAPVVTGAGVSKEQAPAGTGEPEVVNLEEVERGAEVAEEVEKWVEKVKRGDEVRLENVVEEKGEVLVAPAKPQDVKITLPLTEQKMQLGFHRRVVDSLRWLAEWCGRIIKMFPGRVLYRQPRRVP